MSAMETAGKILGMFDRIDDIVYEPVKLMCDAMRQPLKQLDIHNQKSLAEHQQKLDKQMQEFEENLELDRKEREMKMTAEQRKLEEDINQMIADNDLKRRDQMIQMEMHYRKEMAYAAAELEQILVNMQVETRSKIFTLYTERTSDYIDSQNRFEDALLKKVEQIKKFFPGEKGDEKIGDYLILELSKISDRSSEFQKAMNDDMRKVLGTVDTGIIEMTGLAAKYLKPAEPDQWALTQNIVDSIEKK